MNERRVTGQRGRDLNQTQAREPTFVRKSPTAEIDSIEGREGTTVKGRVLAAKHQFISKGGVTEEAFNISSGHRIKA